MGGAGRPFGTSFFARERSVTASGNRLSAKSARPRWTQTRNESGQALAVTSKSARASG